MDTGKLYIIATPIGNLGDIVFRAIEILKQVDLILCEDTRVTKKLLDHFQIKTPTLSYYQHSNRQKITQIKDNLLIGKNLALVTDAGTPGISDPGNLLISELLRDYPALEIVPIPGPSAVITALSVSGFPTDKFVFLGFVPHKNKRNKFFKEVVDSKYTVVFYESNHRIKKTLNELTSFLKEESQIVICRELTKKFETIYRGTSVGMDSMQIKEKGEFVIIVNNK